MKFIFSSSFVKIPKVVCNVLVIKFRANCFQITHKTWFFTEDNINEVPTILPLSPRQNRVMKIKIFHGTPPIR